MFKKDNLEVPSDKINTIIGKDTVFKGTINGKGLIRIDGEVEGNITNTGDIIIGENGSAKVELKTRNITIAGYCEGTVEADGKVELKNTGTAAGSLKTKKLIIEEGAVLSGSTEMQLKDQPAGTTPKSKPEQQAPAGETRGQQPAGDSVKN